MVSLENSARRSHLPSVGNRRGWFTCKTTAIRGLLARAKNPPRRNAADHAAFLRAALANRPALWRVRLRRQRHGVCLLPFKNASGRAGHLSPVGTRLVGPYL